MDQYIYTGIQMERTISAVLVRSLPREQFGFAGIVQCKTVRKSIRPISRGQFRCKMLMYFVRFIRAR